MYSVLLNFNIAASWIKGELNCSDLGTKPLARVCMYLLMHLTGMRRFLQVQEGKVQVINLSDAELVMLCVERMNTRMH